MSQIEVKTMDKRDPNQSWNKGMLFKDPPKKQQPVREPAEESWRSAAPVEEPALIKPAAMEPRPEKKKSKSPQGPHSLKNKKQTAVGAKPGKKTPLQEFDVKAFFEENLYDIIDLEENRSGVREFENAYKDE